MQPFELLGRAARIGVLRSDMQKEGKTFARRVAWRHVDQSSTHGDDGVHHERQGAAFGAPDEPAARDLAAARSDVASRVAEAVVRSRVDERTAGNLDGLGQARREAAEILRHVDRHGQVIVAPASAHLADQKAATAKALLKCVGRVRREKGEANKLTALVVARASAAWRARMRRGEVVDFAACSEGCATGAP